ncbi:MULTISPECIES: hypothetical protein [unclassified Beijerinckia]|uniref:hypothetical protein n=1 Tax=unclassified Beijerinckia TaxID=2638183 RepID=UPI000899EAD0|nr:MULTISPECIES: hypothetical protein [unclassified Beijerinckia]MDH7795261.1 pyruvate/2-oxoglutarate dehydrogenase complex dihydrolipoamide acyltransferase (E2) component [Beijerinckia sp. GAS462]SEB94197.1 hypothetical protein SAMN05443249_1534 [Beijerinckia sp. 28-YEA-48]
MKKASCFGLVAATVFVGSLAANLPAQAQANAMKACGEKWQAAKAANATNNQTWPQFLSSCRKDMASAPAATPAAAPAPAPAAAAPASRAPTASAAAPAPRAPAANAMPASNALFPTAVSPKYSTLSAGKQREKTCLDQYNANKVDNSNGGLKWIQKGGGYYSQCNTRLKGQG